MNGNVTFINARIVASDEVVDGAVRVEDGMIAGIGDAGSGGGEVIDLAGDYLLPGLVELHTDNLERQLQPRPQVRWPADAAMMAHDTQIVGAGITTVCDAVCVGFYGGKRERLEFTRLSLDALHAAAESGALKAEHYLHLRCEVSDPHVLEMFEPLKDEPHLKLVSLMDHTPGQRQWQDLGRYRTFHRGRTEASEAEFQALIERRVAEQVIYAEPHRKAILDLVRDREIVLASHDDTTVAHVEEGAAEGIAISEFPTTMEAASAARAHGMRTIMGAPNVIQGGSHSGNVSAIDLAGAGLLDALSSDYVPMSLLHALFRLHDRLGWSLPQAVALASRNPAAMIGLDDRGVIEPGRRGDLIRVRRHGDTPVMLGVWRTGRRVA